MKSRTCRQCGLVVAYIETGPPAWITKPPGWFHSWESLKNKIHLVNGEPRYMQTEVWFCSVPCYEVWRVEQLLRCYGESANQVHGGLRRSNCRCVIP